MMKRICSLLAALCLAATAQGQGQSQSQGIMAQLTQRILLDMNAQPPDMSPSLGAFAKLYPMLKGKEALGKSLGAFAASVRVDPAIKSMQNLKAIFSLMSSGGYDNTIDCMLTTALAGCWETLVAKAVGEEISRAASFSDKARDNLARIAAAATPDELEAALDRHRALADEAAKAGFPSVASDLRYQVVATEERVKKASAGDYLALGQALLAEGFHYKEAFDYLDKAEQYDSAKDAVKKAYDSLGDERRKTASCLVFGKAYYYYLWASVANPKKEDAQRAFLEYSNGAGKAADLYVRSSFKSGYANGLMRWTILSAKPLSQEYLGYMNMAKSASILAAAIDPKNPDIQRDMMLVSYSALTWTDAVDAADALIALGVDSTETRYYRGMALGMKRERKAEALKDLESVLQREPSHPDRQNIEKTIAELKKQ